MATDRRGRRRRHKRHKARAKGHPIRIWPRRALARELQAMEEFRDEPQESFRFVGGPVDGELHGWDGSTQWTVHTLDIGSWLGAIPEPQRHRYKLKIRREGGVFYWGRNIRRRKLMPLMVYQDV